MAILTETKIANKALQLCGADRIATTLWTEASRNAGALRDTWDISRRYELRRNVWRFAIREQVLRPLDTTSKLVTFPAFAAGTVLIDNGYQINDIVTGSDGQLWIATAVQAAPASDPVPRAFDKWTNYFGPVIADAYSATTTYFAGELVYVGSNVYLSLVNSNIGNAVGNAAYWHTFTVQPTIALFSFVYPIGAGPFSDSSTYQAYKLPYGFLREAPASPRQGSYRSLGAPTNLPYTDHNFEGDFFTTLGTGPATIRFVADIEDPNLFDAMFVGGFAARLALEVVELLTQSGVKLVNIGKLYNTYISEARIVNGIETGPTELPLDDYLAVRR